MQAWRNLLYLLSSGIKAGSPKAFIDRRNNFNRLQIIHHNQDQLADAGNRLFSCSLWWWSPTCSTVTTNKAVVCNQNVTSNQSDNSFSHLWPNIRLALMIFFQSESTPDICCGRYQHGPWRKFCHMEKFLMWKHSGCRETWYVEKFWIQRNPRAKIFWIRRNLFYGEVWDVENR